MQGALYRKLAAASDIFGSDAPQHAGGAGFALRLEPGAADPLPADDAQPDPGDGLDPRERDQRAGDEQQAPLHPGSIANDLTTRKRRRQTKRKYSSVTQTGRKPRDA